MADADGFAGRRFLVTGATGGIGRRVCVSIGRRGGEVLLVARDISRLEEVDREANGASVRRKRVFALDFGNLSSTRAAAAAIEETSGALDGIVLIIPSVPKSAQLLPDDDDWRAALELCFFNPLSILRAGLASTADGGRVVIVSGIASVEVFPELPFSNVVRTAWLAEGKRLSFALGPRRICVNTLSLGGTLTEQFVARNARRTAGDIPHRETPDQIPLGEFGDPDDAAYVVTSLLSRFSNHITGTNVLFDGGFTRAY